jgi:hypothetical protein
MAKISTKQPNICSTDIEIEFYLIQLAEGKHPVSQLERNEFCSEANC